MVNFIVSVINLIISAIGSVLTWAINLLPPSPFNLINNSVVLDKLGYLNWLFPISEALVIFEFWLVAIGLYYLCSVILRHIKIIE